MVQFLTFKMFDGFNFESAGTNHQTTNFNFMPTFLAIHQFVLWLECVCMITTGAISISKMMMVNHSLQRLLISQNDIGDDGITAIAGALGNCRIIVLYVHKCGITLTGARSLAEALSFNHTIRNLGLFGNPITAEGALLLVKSAVHNTVCQDVEIDDEYENNEVKMVMNILEYRRRQEVIYCVV